MYGFHGQLLRIDLDSGKSSRHDLEKPRLRRFLGGIGLGTSLLYEYAPQGVEPFSPANPLIFTSAPLVGTGLTTTAKFGVVTKSPLTGFIGDSLSSSHFALELKRTGLDAVVITGRAASLVYLFISDDQVEIREAEHLRGNSPNETEAAIRSELESSTLRVAAIGKAGENRVRFATISNEGGGAGGEGGGGGRGAGDREANPRGGRRE
ncbi:MAG: aldehyde ferredoxin oxidoreductase N-terminal domain-containing protein [Candidatus Binatia bacterium]